MKERKQYLYHLQWIEAQAQVKFHARAEFGACLPRIRRRLQQDLRADAGEREFALAAAVTLTDRAALQVGNPQYLAENGSQGALKLRNRHLRLSGNEISRRHTAKGGQRVWRGMTGAKLARVLGKINDLPGATLLTWLDEEGNAQTLRSDALNTYIAQAAGVEGATAKTFRTWAGTCAAFEVAQDGHATIKEMAAAAASRLHNTPTIARKSHIHPDVVALAGQPPVEVVANALRGLKDAGQRVLGFLERNG